MSRPPGSLGPRRTRVVWVLATLFTASVADAALHSLRQDREQPALTVRAADGLVSVKANFVSIREVLDELGRLPGVGLGVATGVWGLVQYDSGRPKLPGQVLRELTRRYALRLNRKVTTTGPKLQVEFTIAPLNAEAYFATDADFFRRYVMPAPEPAPPLTGIPDGEVYVDGHFIRPPYVIGVGDVADSKDKQVTINGVAACRVPYPVQPPIADPGKIAVPKNANNISAGENVASKLVRKYEFWVTVHGREQARRMLAGLLRSVPGLKGSTFSVNGSCVVIENKDGTKELLSLRGPLKVPQPSPAKFREQARANALVYSLCLKKKGTVLIFTNGTHVFLASSQGAALKRRVALLASSGFDRRLKLDLLRQIILSLEDRCVFLANYATTTLQPEGRH